MSWRLEIVEDVQPTVEGAAVNWKVHGAGLSRSGARLERKSSI
jgi:hypothetical protein